MKSASNVLSGYYTYLFGAELTVKNLYEYPGYRILMVQVNPKYESANAATDNFVKGLLKLSDKEKVKGIAVYIADRITYNSENVAGIKDIFTSPTPVNGICGTYSRLPKPLSAIPQRTDKKRTSGTKRNKTCSLRLSCMFKA